MVPSSLPGCQIPEEGDLASASLTGVRPEFAGAGIPVLHVRYLFAVAGLRGGGAADLCGNLFAFCRRRSLRYGERERGADSCRRNELPIGPLAAAGVRRARTGIRGHRGRKDD